MKAFALFALALIHATSATLTIKGPSEPVLEYDSVTLECLYTDPELNSSQTHFQMKYPMRSYRGEDDTWYDIDGSQLYGGYRCMSFLRAFYKKAEETPGKLNIHDVRAFSGFFFRCVSDIENITAPDNVSEPLSYKAHYMYDASLFSSYFRSYQTQEIKVRAGEDVKVKCSASSSEEPKYYWKREFDEWILPSSVLNLTKVSPADAGKYTCVAEHPTVKSLSKTDSFKLLVLTEDAAWYETTNGRLYLMASAAAACLIMFSVSVAMFLCRRAKRIRARKGPIDDRSQKKPIYKTSVESLPSTVADKQPLV